MKRFGFSATDIGDLFAYLGVWITFSQGFLTGWLARRLSPYEVFKIFPLVISLAFWALLLPHQAWVLFLILPFISASRGVAQPNLNAILSEAAGQKRQGEVMGITQAIRSFCRTFAPLIAGLLAAWHITIPIIMAGLITFLAWFSFVLFFKKENLPPLSVSLPPEQ